LEPPTCDTAVGTVGLSSSQILREWLHSGTGGKGIQVKIPPEATKAGKIAADLETAFREMKYEQVRVET
jgi:hypothetical protein